MRELAERLYAIVIAILIFSSLVKPAQCYQQLFSCNFEMGNRACAVTQWDHPYDNFDWTRWRGLTGGAYSGPSSDHTYGNNTGNYMYTQSNADRRGENAILQIGNRLELSAGRGLLRFYYHMEDRDAPDTLGDLKVYVCHRDGRSVGTPVWKRSKSQGNRWLMAEIVFECEGPFQVLFEGIRGARDSDIAIDDIVLLDLLIDESVPYVSTSVAMTTMMMRSPPTSVSGSGDVHEITRGSAVYAERSQTTVTTSSSPGRSVAHNIDTNNQDTNSKKKLILLVGLAALMFCITLLLVVLVFICYIRKQRHKEVEVSSSVSVDGVLNPYLYDRSGYVELQGPVPSIYTKLQVASIGGVEMDASAYMSLQNISTTTSSFKRMPISYNSNTVPAHPRGHDAPVYMDPEIFRRHYTRKIGSNPTYGMDVVNQVGYYHIPDVITQANQRDTHSREAEVNFEQYHEYFVLEKEGNTEEQKGQDELESYHADDEEDINSDKARSRLYIENDSYLDLCGRGEETLDSIRLSDYQADESDSDDYHCLGPNDLGFSGYQIDSQLNNLSAPSRTYIENTLDYTHV